MHIDDLCALGSVGPPAEDYAAPETGNRFRTPTISEQ